MSRRWRWMIVFGWLDSPVAEDGCREGVPTYLFRILPAYICINSAQALRHSHRTPTKTSLLAKTLLSRNEGTVVRHGSCAAISIMPLVKKSLVMLLESFRGAREDKKIRGTSRVIKISSMRERVLSRARARQTLKYLGKYAR